VSETDQCARCGEDCPMTDCLLCGGCENTGEQPCPGCQPSAAPGVSSEQRANLMAWLRYCEAHPVLWQRGEVRIPLAQVGLTWDEVDAMFDRPSLAEVRAAVEEFLAPGEVPDAEG
jgi:hypothetical protein